jgi:hypothetical protein
MALGSTQPLTEMSTRNIAGGKGRPPHKTDNLTAICVPTALKMREPQRLTTLWASKACYRNSFTFFLTTTKIIILVFWNVTPCCLANRCQRSVLKNQIYDITS